MEKDKKLVHHENTQMYLLWNVANRDVSWAENGKLKKQHPRHMSRVLFFKFSTCLEASTYRFPNRNDVSLRTSEVVKR